LNNPGWQYWNDDGKDKKFTVPFKKEEFIKLIPKDASLFDFGCGYGRILSELQNEGYNNLYGCDFSLPMLKAAGRKINSNGLLQNDGVKIPFKENSFDAVMIVAVLTCIIRDNDQKKLMNEVKRVIKPGGILFIADFLLNTDERNMQRYSFFENKYDKYGVFEIEPDVPVRHHDQKQLDDLFTGFTQISFKTTVFNTMNGHESNGFYYFGKKN